MGVGVKPAGEPGEPGRSKSPSVPGLKPVCGAPGSLPQARWARAPSGGSASRGGSRGAALRIPPPVCVLRAAARSVPLLHPGDIGARRGLQSLPSGALPVRKELPRTSEVCFFSADMGDFVDTEQRKMVPQGQAAVLNLLPISSYPRPQVTWFREGHKIIPSNRM